MSLSQKGAATSSDSFADKNKAHDLDNVANIMKTTKNEDCN